jgi:hypothetical protein
MKKKELIEFRAEMEKVIIAREALGEFDANSKYMIFMLHNMRAMVQHMIDTYPKAKNGKPNSPNV